MVQDPMAEETEAVTEHSPAQDGDKNGVFGDDEEEPTAVPWRQQVVQRPMGTSPSSWAAPCRAGTSQKNNLLL
jgi:hypothetical protein